MSQMIYCLIKSTDSQEIFKDSKWVRWNINFLKYIKCGGIHYVMKSSFIFPAIKIQLSTHLLEGIKGTNKSKFSILFLIKL